MKILVYVCVYVSVKSLSNKYAVHIHVHVRISSGKHARSTQIQGKGKSVKRYYHKIGYEALVLKQAEWVLLIVGCLYSWGANKHMYYSGSIQLCGNELAVTHFRLRGSFFC